QKRITVFGAGIAGLTAAHELAMRGFEVQVIDAEYNAEYHDQTHDRGIGGMARSQWAVAPEGPLSGGDMRRLWSGRELLLDTVIDFDSSGRPLDSDRATAVVARLATAIQMLRAERLPPSKLTIFVSRTAEAELDDDALDGDPRVKYIKEQLGLLRIFG